MCTSDMKNVSCRFCNVIEAKKVFNTSGFFFRLKTAFTCGACERDVVGKRKDKGLDCRALCPFCGAINHLFTWQYYR